MAAQQIPTIEGISPYMLWIFLVVLVGIMALIVLGDKVLDVFRNAKRRRQEQSELNGQDITDRIATKVIEKLTPTLDSKFDEIERKFAADKEMLEMHTTQLNAHQDRVDRLDNDTKALLHGMSALLSHQVTGNSIEKLQKTYTATNNYLIDRVYKEESWT